MVRTHDVSGVSGIGVVAKGCIFYTRCQQGLVSQHVVLSWIKEPQCLSVWHSIEDLLLVHGHGNSTRINWIDDEHEWERHPDWYDSSVRILEEGQSDLDPGKR